MTATYVGSYTIGGAVPAAEVAATAGVSGINAAIPDIAARLAALQAQIVALGAMPPLPSFADMLARAQATLASMQLAIATPGLPPPPSIATAIAALAALVSSLTATIGSINAQLGAVVGFQTLLARAGVHVVAFESAAGNVGAELQSAINTPIPSGTARGVMLVTTSGTTWGVMQQVFRVTP